MALINQLPNLIWFFNQSSIHSISQNYVRECHFPNEIYLDSLLIIYPFRIRILSEAKKVNLSQIKQTSRKELLLKFHLYIAASLTISYRVSRSFTVILVSLCIVRVQGIVNNNIILRHSGSSRVTALFFSSLLQPT